MSKLLETLVLTNEENGENYEISRKDYEKQVIAKLEVPAMKNEESGKEVFAATIVEHIVKNVMKGTEMDETIASKYANVVEVVTADVKQHGENVAKAKGDKEAEKEAKARAKEEEKKKQEEENAIRVQRQEGILSEAKTGIETAAGEFKETAKNLIENLPSSITLVQEGAGYGLKFAEDISDADMAQGFGYLMQQGLNNQALANQIQFWLGDMVLLFLAKGIYVTAKEAGEAVNKLLPEHMRYAPSMMDQFKKMAERTPIALRNPQASPSAYLALANVKIPKKGDKEDDASYQKRLAEFKSGREEMQKKLATGEWSTNKDVKEVLEDFEIKHGLKEKKSEEDLIPISFYFKQYFFAEMGLKLVGAQGEKGVTVYKDGDTKYELTEEELEDLRDKALAKLQNVYYSNTKEGVTFKDYENGFFIKKVKAVKDDGKNGAKKEDEEVQVKLFPSVFWEIKKEEKTEESKEKSNEPAVA